MNITSNNSFILSSPKPSFAGRSGLGNFTGITGAVDKTFSWLGANRTREMLVEDFVGFGVLRTGMDLFRGYFFGDDEALNVPAARERLFREASSIVTDNMAAGVAALGLAKVLDRSGKSFGAQFVDFKSMELFKELMAKSSDESAFLKNLATSILNSSGEKAVSLKQVQVLEALLKDLNSENASKKAVQIAKLMGKQNFDLLIPLQGLKPQVFKPQVFKLDELLENVNILKSRVEKTTYTGTWAEKSQALIAKTLKTKSKLLACLGVGVGLTMMVPVVNQWLTRKIDGIETYPGERGRVARDTFGVVNESTAFGTGFQSGGLKVGTAFSGFVIARNVVQKKTLNQAQKRQSFVSKSLNEGKKLPLALSLLPLPFALGLFDTVKRRFVNPFAKGFGKQWKNMYDFGKKFPFTTQQQIASMFAVLIMARLFNARSENEFRERLVDSSLGWGIWILATPYIKEKAAQLIDKMTGSKLLKRVGEGYELRSRSEIEKLLPKKLVNKTLKKNIWIGATSTIATMLLLGVLEPYLAIQWTKRNTVAERGV